MSLDLEQPLQVAAVQLECRLGDLAYNLEHAERLAEEAFAGGARIVALPEFFSTRIALDPRVHACVLEGEHAALALLRRLARRHQGWIGGSVLQRRGGEVYNSYLFVEPDGRCHTHDKDLPTMWENCYYVGGQDDGCFDTALGGVGAAVCWELIRTQTIERLRGRIRLAMTGNHWWSGPENWPGFARLLAPVLQYNRYLSENAPVEFARALGVPVLHASHAGEFEGRFLLLPGSDVSLPYRTRFVGATQIVDAAGRVLAYRNVAQGAGVVHAELRLQPQAPQVEASRGFWHAALPLFHKLYWQQQNRCGRSHYLRHNNRHDNGAQA